MRVKEYLEALNKLVNDNPGALELELITSIDDEGNGYNRVFYTPSLAIYDGSELIVTWDENEEEIPVTIDKANCICLN